MNLKALLISPVGVLSLIDLFYVLRFQHEFINSYKQSRRREDDIAIVNAGMRVLLKPAVPHWTVQECSLVYGGMSYKTVVAKKTQSALLGK